MRSFDDRSDAADLCASGLSAVKVCAGFRSGLPHALLNPDELVDIAGMTPASEIRLEQRRLTCAQCGKAFDCGSGGRDGGCWCMDEPVRAPMPAADGGDCLCPSCFRAMAGEAQRPG